MMLVELLVKTMLEINLVNAEVLVPQKYYEMFMVMLNNKVFEQKNAAITLHFDQIGVLQTIQRADFLYSKKHQKV